MGKKHRFPPRSYGPFIEDNFLQTGLRGTRTFGIDGSNLPFDYVYALERSQHRVRVFRQGVRRKKPIDLAPSNFLLDRTNHTCTGTVKVLFPLYNQHQSYTNSLVEAFGAPVYAYEDLGYKARAEIKALLKLKNQSVNLGVAFAERSRTAALVGDSARAIAESVVAFRRGNFRKAFAFLKAKPLRSQKVTQQWLALQYGWTPLMLDVLGSAKALAERALVDYDVRVASQIGGTRNSSQIIDRANFRFEETTKGLCSYRVALNYSPLPSLIRKFSSLGLTNPAEILWELVPFSFVVDWFTPVGSWLSSLDAAAGWSYKSGTLTRLSECKVRQVFVPTKIPGTTRSGQAILQQERRVIQRTVYASSPIVGRPGMKDPRSLKHMANAMALLVSVFEGSKSLRGLSKLR